MKQKEKRKKLQESLIVKRAFTGPRERERERERERIGFHW